MALTCLQIIQAAYSEMGLTQPGAVVGSSDPQVIQFLALANRVGVDVARDFEWRQLDKQYVFQTSAGGTVTGNTTLNSTVVSGVSSTASLSAGMVVSGSGFPDFTNILSIDSATQFTTDMAADAAGTGTTITYSVQDYALPSDFGKMISKTNFDRTDFWANLGPKSAQEWQWLQSGNISTAPRFRYRTFGNKLRFFPAPGAVYNMVYEYQSVWWVLASGGSVPTKSLFSLDTDTCIFGDDVMVLGLKYQWYRSNGLDFTLPLAEFMRALDIAKATDQDNPTLNLAPRLPAQLLNISAVPEGSWDLN